MASGLLQSSLLAPREVSRASGDLPTLQAARRANSIVRPADPHYGARGQLQRAPFLTITPPDKIRGCEQLVLKKQAIAKNQRIFRLQRWGDVILVREDLVEMLQSAGLTGLLFVRSEDYTGIG